MALPLTFNDKRASYAAECPMGGALECWLAGQMVAARDHQSPNIPLQFDLHLFYVDEAPGPIVHGYNWHDYQREVLRYHPYAA